MTTNLLSLKMVEINFPNYYSRSAINQVQVSPTFSVHRYTIYLFISHFNKKTKRK